VIEVPANQYVVVSKVWDGLQGGLERWVVRSAVGVDVDVDHDGVSDLSSEELKGLTDHLVDWLKNRF